MAKTTLEKTSTEALMTELFSRTDCLVVGDIWSVNFLMGAYNIDNEMATLFIRKQQKACLGLASARDDLHEAITDFVEKTRKLKEICLKSIQRQKEIMASPLDGAFKDVPDSFFLTPRNYKIINNIAVANTHERILDLLPVYNEAVTKIESRSYNEQGLVVKMRWIEAALTRLKAGGEFKYSIFNILKLMKEVINEANNI